MSETQARDVPHAAGIYDYALGGTANTAADRAVVEHVKEFMPEVVYAAWANRGFLQRAVKRMAAEFGIRQFIDLGAGMPTQRNTHEVVADVRPDGRVVYVDHDPRVIARGREIIADAPGTALVEADIQAVEKVLDDPRTQNLIDFTEPVGLLAVAVIHFVPDTDDPWGFIARYLARLAPGSYLALSSITGDHQAPRITEGLVKATVASPTPAVPRSREEIERFFAGLEIVPPYEGADPAVTYVGLWGAEDPEAADDDGSRLAYAAVGRKP
jgi:SAM-dependent methyltransferase